MKLRKKNTLWFVFLCFYILFYFLWLTVWKSEENILTLGGNILSFTSGGIATVWLLSAAQKKPKKDKLFWYLLAGGTYSFFLAEFLWMGYENILDVAVPSPGLPDLFFLLQVGFYLAAFSYKITREKKQNDFIKFVFDVLIIMTVASTFSWHFLLQPLSAANDVSAFALAVSLAYPVGDLALLFGATILLFGMHQTFFNSTVFYLFLGMFTLSIADSFYLYFVSNTEYNAGNYTDPLFTLSVLLIGFTGLIGREEKTDPQTSSLDKTPNKVLTLLRLVFPYVTVTILFIFMMVRSKGIDIITIGSGLSILLVIIRQIFVQAENLHLMRQVSDKKEALEISEYRYKSFLEPSAAGRSGSGTDPKNLSAPTPDERIKFLAYHDSLTGLANRAMFEELLNQAVADAALSKKSFAVMFLDLDNFKKINDTMGHNAGDQLLILIAERLKKCVRKNDLVARLGGDEFTFLIREISNPKDVAFMAEKIIHALSQPYKVDGQMVASTPSVGIALYPLNGQDPATLLKNADRAMYQVKENGKGHYFMAEAEDSTVN